MNLAAVLLLGLLGAPVAAGAAWLLARTGSGGSARQRVFNAAAVAPAVIAVGAAAFTLVILTLGGDQRFTGAHIFLVEALTASLAAFNVGLVAAYLVERSQRN